MSASLYGRLLRRFGQTQDTLTRRQFLKSGTAAAAGLLLSSCQTTQNIRAGSRGRVIVVGAGFAGLAAAFELQSAGYSATVLEARKRIGGRVLSFDDFVRGKVVEGGAELVGSNHPTWMAYASRFGLDFLDVTEEEASMPILINGRILSDDESRTLLEQLDAGFSSMNADAGKVDADQPWNTPSAETLDRRSAADWVISLNVPDRAKYLIAIELQANNGTALHRQSYLGNLAQVKGGGVERFWTESEVYRCKGGNQRLATKLAAAIGNERIILNAPVLAIETTPNSVKVTTADSRVWEADDLILTIPPSVWAKIQIYPELPPALRPQMGTNIKYLLALDRPAWQDSKRAAAAYTDREISMTWHQTDGQDDKGPVSLCAFSGGPAAEAMLAISAEQRDAAYGVILEQLYPGIARAKRATRLMDWPRDPWTMAGYSFPAPGQVTGVGPLLQRPHGRVHFAGEHTCYKFVGYMEGGLSSGAAVARRIAERV